MDYTSIDQALEVKLELVTHIQGIDVQIAENELKMSEEEYRAWRVRALRARHILISKLQRVKLWIQRQREQASKERVAKRGSGDGLLADLYALTKSLVAEGAQIDSTEQQLLDDIAAFLNS